MITAESFDRTTYNQFELYTKTQQYLLNLTNDNISDILTFILQEKDIIGNPAGVSILAQSFYDVANFRPKNIEVHAHLLELILREKDSTNHLNLLTKYIIRKIHTIDDLTNSKLFFLRNIFDRKLITIKSIINEIKIINLGLEKDNNIVFSHTDMFINERLRNIVNWFYLEIINSNDTEFLDSIKTYINNSSCYYENNSKEMINQMLKTGYNPEKIAEIIRNDDIDAFSQLYSLNSDNFNFNKSIRPECFERVDLFLDYPNLIQYAAFFNSIKIFKNLVLHHANFEEKEDELMLLECAIAGGSFEIIRFLEQNKINMINGIPYAIKYCRNDILTWILDNHMHSYDNHFIIEPDEETKFTNHFLDFDDYFFSCDEPYYCNYESFEKDESAYQNMLVYNREDNPIDNNFKYINFDCVFKAIAESNNLQALFILLDHEMDINACSNTTKKTLLHYAVQKGNCFLTKLLLSFSSINWLLRDKDGETQLLYSIKYQRIKIFHEFIKYHDKIKNKDFVEMIFYCVVLKLDDLLSYIITIWPIDLLTLMKKMIF